MAEEMAGGVLEGAETEIRPETVSTEVAVATPDAMVVDDVNSVGASVAPVEPEVSQPEVVDEKPVPGTVQLYPAMPGFTLASRALLMQKSVHHTLSLENNDQIP